MKLKYYLRGLGIGIIVTTIILMVSFSKREAKISDDEVITRAMQLGMVMQEADDQNGQESDAEQEDNQEPDAGTSQDNEQEPDAGTSQDNEQEPDAGTNQDSEQEPEEGVNPGEDGAETDPNEVQEPEEGMNPGEAQEPDAAGDEPEEAGTAEDQEIPTGTVPGDGNYRLVIQKGDVCRVVCEKLAENGVITDAEALRKYLFQIGYASNMSVGEYEIPYNSTNEEVASILQAGPLENE